jgi:hypothetical protein
MHPDINTIEIVNILKVDVNERKRTAKVVVSQNNKKYTLIIPSRYFPLSNPSTIRFFWPENTEPLTDSATLSLINQLTPEFGHCYANITDLCNLLSKHNVSVEYYSGWMFEYKSGPAHHAWGVINGNHVIDFSMGQTFRKMLIDMAENDDEKEDWRTKVAKGLLEKQRTMKNSELYVMGKCLEGVLYVGSQSDEETSNNLIKQALALPDNPMYKLENVIDLHGGHSKINQIYHSLLKRK